jgi:phospholipase C
VSSKLRVARVAFGVCTLFSLTTTAFAEGDLQKVRHIIIVMQENHSFDN